MKKSLTKVLSASLAVLIASNPLTTFSQKNSAKTCLVYSENFNNKLISSSWNKIGGSMKFSENDYGYLEFSATESNASIEKNLGLSLSFSGSYLTGIVGFARIAWFKLS